MEKEKTALEEALVAARSEVKINTEAPQRKPMPLPKKLRLKPKRLGKLPKTSVPAGKMLSSDGAPLSAPS